MNHGEKATTHAQKLVLDRNILPHTNQSQFYYKQRTDASKHKNEILESLAYKRRIGKSIRELSNDTRLSKDTILTHVKELIKNSYVRKEGGKRGKYYITEIALGSPGLRGILFESRAYDKIMSRKVSIINKFTKKHAPKNTTLEEEVLFTIQNKIAAYLLYIMIEAMRPNFGGLVKVESGIDKDDLVKQWVNGAIHPELILKQFCELGIVKHRLGKYSENPYPRNSPYYEMDKTVFEGLRNTFRTLNPDIFKELETLREKIPESVERLIDRRKTALEKNDASHRCIDHEGDE